MKTEALMREELRGDFARLSMAVRMLRYSLLRGLPEPVTFIRKS
jgi:hypothetical protein